MGFYHSPLVGHIREYLLNSRPDQTIFLYVPYIKADMLTVLLEGVKNRLVIVTTWNPRDIQFGSSELSVYRFCKRRDAALYVSKNMHLKVYSVGLETAILATGNVSRRGMLPGRNRNYEAATGVERLSNEDRLFLQKIRNEARLVDDAMYYSLREWEDANRIEKPEEPSLEDIIPARRDDFLTSALPMTRNVGDLVLGYTRIQQGEEPSEDGETAACILHDIVNYGIEPGLSSDGFVKSLQAAFFAHPFIRKIEEFIDPEAYFGRIKEWIQENCTDVPVPSRRELTGNVQVLLEWFVKLSDGKYTVDVPGAKSQRIRKNLD